ncbi:hypothetical protein ACFWA6_13110 [Streptomyces sp. NPDC060020]|uniref:hypothetical protein n=1 Tax=Streptomyces sp. NPDC060020 TaxID=3347038 RepID=UPI0036AB61F7
MSLEYRTGSDLGPLPRRHGWLTGGTLASLALVMVGIAGPASAASQGVRAAEAVGASSPAGGGDKCKPKPHKKQQHGPRAAESMAGPRGGDKCDQGKQGPPGPRGPRGATGATGPRGATGPEGPEGPQGGIGPQGATGVQGEVGPQGPTGLQGETGAQGATGVQGPQGPQGLQGAQGATGGQGPQGATGVSECLDIDSIRDNNDREFKAVLPGDGNAYAGIRELSMGGTVVGAWSWYDLTTNPLGRYPEDACAISIGHQANRLVIEVVTRGGVIWETFCDVNTGPNTLTCNRLWNRPMIQPDEGDPDLRRTAGATSAPARPVDPNHLPKQLK